jgi:cobyrinic acid a,c-diamide synthase
LVEAGNDDPLADIFDGNGRRLGKTGGRRGRVTGTFFHVIAGELPAQLLPLAEVEIR